MTTMNQILEFLSTEGVPASLSTILRESLPEEVQKDGRIGTMMELLEALAQQQGVRLPVTGEFNAMP